MATKRTGTANTPAPKERPAPGSVTRYKKPAPAKKAGKKWIGEKRRIAKVANSVEPDSAEVREAKERAEAARARFQTALAAAGIETSHGVTRLPRAQAKGILTEQANAVLDLVGLTGKSFTAAIREVGVPPSSFWNTVADDEHLREKHARVKKASANFNAERATIVLEQALDNSIDNPFAGASVTAANNLGHHLRWLAARQDRDSFGDRHVVAGDKDAPIAITISADDDAL